MTQTIVKPTGIEGLEKLNFPVTTAPVYLALGKAIDGHKAIVRPDTGQVLSIVSDQYELVTYRQQYEPYLERLDHDGWKVKDVRVEADGARAYIELDNTIKTYEVKAGDPIGQRLILAGSYNATVGIQARGGLRVLWCQNGAVVIHGSFNETIRHVGDPLGRIEKSAQNFGVNVEGELALYRGLADTAVSKEVAHAVIEEVCGKRQLDLVTSFYGAGHAGANQENAWGLYNSITAYLTHHFGGSVGLREKKNREALDLITHPEKVREIIENQRKEAAASN